MNAVMYHSPYLLMKVKSLVQCIKQEMKVDSVPGLPSSELKTAVIVDATYMICQSPFQKDQKFNVLGNQSRQKLLNDVPNGTKLIHLCCDKI